MREWWRVGRALQKILPAELQDDLSYFLDPSRFDEVCFQFALCELSKLIAYVIFELPIYARHYWMTAFQEWADGKEVLGEPWLAGFNIETDDL